MNRDLYSNVAFGQSMMPQTVTAAVDGTGIDCALYESACAELSVATVGGTSTPTLTFQLQESDASATGYTAVAAADVIGAAGETSSIVVGTTNDEAIHKRGYIGGKRYLRWSCTAVSGSSPTVIASGSIVRGNPRSAPV